MTKESTVEDDKYLSIKQAAEYLSVSRTTMYRLIYDGEIRYYQKGYKHRIRIKKSDLISYMERMKN